MNTKDLNLAWSIDELAEKLAVKPATVKRWFKGEYETINGKSYISILNALEFVCGNEKYATILTGLDEEFCDHHSLKVCVRRLINNLGEVLPMYVEGLPAEITGKIKITTTLDLRKI